MNKEAAEIFAKALESDASDHDAGHYEDIGMKWDDIYGELLPIEDEINLPIYGLAFRFWDDWCDAANHDWKYHEPIPKSSWPIFAREIANALREGQMPVNRIILEHFTPQPHVSLWQRIKRGFTNNA